MIFNKKIYALFLLFSCVAHTKIVSVMGESDGNTVEQVNHELLERRTILRQAVIDLGRQKFQRSWKEYQESQDRKSSCAQKKADTDFEIIKQRKMQFCICKKCFSNYSIACRYGHVVKIGESYDHVAERTTDLPSKL